MAILATYVDTSQFCVDGDHTEDFPSGLRVKLLMLYDGHLITDIVVAEYDSGTDLTTCTTLSAAITVNLTEVLLGHNFVDDVNEESNLALHDHSALHQGGEQAFSGFTDAAKVARLNYISTAHIDSAGLIFGVNDIGDDLIRYHVIGTTNQVDVDVSGGFITISGPQDLDVTATPEFAGLILTAFEGVIYANDAGEFLSIVPTAGSQKLRSNAGNTAYEWITDTMSSHSDVLVANLTHGDTWKWLSNVHKWVNTSYIEGAPEEAPTPVDLGTVLGLIMTFGE